MKRLARVAALGVGLSTSAAAAQPTDPLTCSTETLGALSRAQREECGGAPSDACATRLDALVAREPCLAALLARVSVYQRLDRFVEATDQLERFPPSLVAALSPGDRVEYERLVTLNRAQRASVRLEITPPQTDATVTCDGRRCALVDGVVHVNPGVTTLAVEAPGRRRWELAVTAMRGERITRAARLEPIPIAPGRLRLDVAPPFAEVSLDGRLVGVGSQDRALSAGPHTLSLSARDFLALRRVFSVEPGAVTALSFSLDRARDAPRSVLSRWWFWTIVGAVVTAGVVTAVGLASVETPCEALVRREGVDRCL